MIKYFLLLIFYLLISCGHNYIIKSDEKIYFIEYPDIVRRNNNNEIIEKRTLYELNNYIIMSPTTFYNLYFCHD